MAPKATPTARRAHELLRYGDGKLYWREPGPKHSTGAVGTPAGVGGRLQVIVDRRSTYVHHLVWLMHHGEWPATQIDHTNGDNRDNRIENLRLVTNGQNTQNVRRRGVSFDSRKVERPWRARIMVNGRSISLGYYDTEAEALAEYQRAKLVYHEAWATGIAAA